MSKRYKDFDQASKSLKNVFVSIFIILIFGQLLLFVAK